MLSTAFAPIVQIDTAADMSDVYAMPETGFPNGRRFGDDVMDVTINTLAGNPGNPNGATTPANAFGDPSEAAVFVLPDPGFDPNDGGMGAGYGIEPSPLPAQSSDSDDPDGLSFEDIVLAASVAKDPDESLLDELIGIVSLLAEPIPYSEQDIATATTVSPGAAPVTAEVPIGDGDIIL